MSYCKAVIKLAPLKCFIGAYKLHLYVRNNLDELE